jgi:hypothetical protein
MHGGRKFDGFASDLLKLAGGVVEQIEFYAVFVAEFLEDVIPFVARAAGEFGGDEAGDVLERFAGGPGNQGVPAEAELDAGDDEERRAQEGDVQKKPEQNFQVEWESGFHLADSMLLRLAHTEMWGNTVRIRIEIRIKKKMRPAERSEPPLPVPSPPASVPWARERECGVR